MPQNQKLTEKSWFIIFLIIIFFPAGLYLMWKNKKFSKKARIIITGIILVMGVISINNSLTNSSADDPKKKDNLIASNDSKETDTSDSKENDESDTAVAASTDSTIDNPESSDSDEPSIKTLGLTLDEFTDLFNQNIANLKLDIRLSVQYTGEDAVVGTVNDNVAFSFNLKPGTKEIVSLIMIGVGDGTMESGTIIMSGMCATLASVDTSISLDKTGEIILDVLNGNNKTLNGVQYSSAASDKLGTMLFVVPVEEK